MIEPQPTNAESMKADIPENRIHYAKAFGTWGSESWRDLYASSPLDWADNEIRMMNRCEQQSPDPFTPEETQRRDTLFRWRNAYLAEYNSAVGRMVEPELEESFQSIYTSALNKAYADNPDGLEAAKKRFEGFQARRKASSDYKRSGEIEEYSPDDDLFAGTGQWARD